MSNDPARIAELEQQVAVLEARVAGLRGLGTPGLVIEALDQIKRAAADGLAVAEQQVVFWTTVGEWADKLVTEEREEWGDLVDGLPIHRTEAGWPRCSTCDGGGCPDCTDPA